MSRKIVLSKRASRKLEKLLEYLETEWSIRIKNNFVKKLDRALQILKDKPESSPKSDRVSNLYKCVVTKQTTFYYKFDNKKLYVVTIFDTRQDPKKLNKGF
jgi:plasmid stabilization system protein ParE